MKSRYATSFPLSYNDCVNYVDLLWSADHTLHNLIADEHAHEKEALMFVPLSH
jgi:hypothetical protein